MKMNAKLINSIYIIIIVSFIILIIVVFLNPEILLNKSQTPEPFQARILIFSGLIVFTIFLLNEFRKYIQYRFESETKLRSIVSQFVSVAARSANDKRMIVERFKKKDQFDSFSIIKITPVIIESPDKNADILQKISPECYTNYQSYHYSVEVLRRDLSNYFNLIFEIDMASRKKSIDNETNYEKTLMPLSDFKLFTDRLDKI